MFCISDESGPAAMQHGNGSQNLCLSLNLILMVLVAGIVIVTNWKKTIIYQEFEEEALQLLWTKNETVIWSILHRSVFWRKPAWKKNKEKIPRILSESSQN